MGLGFLLTRLGETGQEPGVARSQFTQTARLRVTCPAELLRAAGGR